MRGLALQAPRIVRSTKLTWAVLLALLCFTTDKLAERKQRDKDIHEALKQQKAEAKDKSHLVRC